MIRSVLGSAVINLHVPIEDVEINDVDSDLNIRLIVKLDKRLVNSFRAIE